MTEKIQPEINKDDVIAKIGVILNDVSVMGFNDSEIPELIKLMDDVKNNNIDPQKALEKAHQIKNNKQDYH